MNKNRKRVWIVFLGSVLFFAILVYSFLPGTNFYPLTEEEIRGQDVLDHLEKQDPKDVQEKINAASPSPSASPSPDPTAHPTSNPTYPLPKRYSRALIMGDSIVEAISDYTLLNSNQVIGVRGKRVDNITAQLDQAISLRPEVIFMEYGSNDIESFLGNVDYYITHYQKDIQYLKEQLEGVKIYVLAILPVQEWVVLKDTAFQHLELYNQKLAAMCETEGCIFLDTTSMLTDDLYEPDGIHPVYRFYKPWLTELANQAGL